METFCCYCECCYFFLPFFFSFHFPGADPEVFAGRWRSLGGAAHSGVQVQSSFWWGFWGTSGAKPPPTPKAEHFCIPNSQFCLSTSTIQDNQPAEAGNRHWVGQAIAAFHRSRHWSVASPAWVGRPTSRRTNWTFDVKTASCELLQTITETINNCCFEDTWHFTR